MISAPESNFVPTRGYRRFAEFCEACQRYRYIGLCYGPPGVGKTLSARQYADWEPLEALQGWKCWRGLSTAEVEKLQGHSTVLYTPTVVNSPGQVNREIASLRQKLHDVSLEPLVREEDALFNRVRQYDAERSADFQERLLMHDYLQSPLEETPRTEPTLEDIGFGYQAKRRQIPDPTTLVIIDEADRLKMAGLEQVRAIFDRGGIGLVLIGMPGLEKRLARYPQLYSRVGFVHAFQPLNAEEVRLLLAQKWHPAEVSRTFEGILAPEVLNAIVRITGGNFRLLDRLLSQMARVLEINALPAVTVQVVEAARESLVIGVT